MKQLDVRNLVKDGAVHLSPLEFVAVFGDELRNLPLSKARGNDGWHVLFEDVYSKTSGSSWSGEDKIVWYGRPKAGHTVIEMSFAAFFNNGYANEQDQIQMGDDFEILREDWQFIILKEDDEQRQLLHKRVEGALCKASLGDLCIIARQLNIIE